ncbi:class I SAM-dependent methyltransferase [bacterium]|nr:class I SAM-dependent methyltransferase [bacterium]
MLAQIDEEDYFDGTGSLGNPEGYLSQASGYRARSGFMVEWMQKLCRLQGGRWLDVGCGPGFLVEAASKAGYDACGLDVSKTAVKFGRENLGLNLEVGHAENLPECISGSFDVITLFDGLFHVRDPRMVLNYVHAALKSGGALFAGPFDLHPPDWKPPTVIRNIESLGIPEHVSFVNQTSMEFLLNELEFQDLRFLPMPEAPSTVLTQRFGMAPPWLMGILRKLVRRVGFFLHRAASRVVNRKAGCVFATKAGF